MLELDLFIFINTVFLIFYLNFSDLPTSLPELHEDERNYDILFAVGLVKRKVYSKSKSNMISSITVCLTDPKFGKLSETLDEDMMNADSERSLWH